MAPRPAKPPSDDLLSSLASLAPAQDPHHVALPFLLARPNYPFYLTPTPTSTTSPSPTKSNQRKVRRRDKGSFSGLPLINVAARVPPRFQPLPNGSWVASDCWTLHGRQSCNPSPSSSSDPSALTPSATSTHSPSTSTTPIIDMSSLPKGWQPRTPHTNLYPIPTMIVCSIVLSGIIISMIMGCRLRNRRKKEMLRMDPEWNRKYQKEAKGGKKRRKKKKVEERSLDDNGDDDGDGDVPGVEVFASAKSTTIAASESLSKRKGLRERLKSARRLPRFTERRRESRDGLSVAQPRPSDSQIREHSLNEELDSSPPSGAPSQRLPLSVTIGEGEIGEEIPSLPATNDAHLSVQFPPPSLSVPRPLRSFSTRTLSTGYSTTESRHTSFPTLPPSSSVPAQPHSSPISVPESIHSPVVSFPSQPPAYQRVARRTSGARPDDLDLDTALGGEEDDEPITPSHNGNNLHDYTEGHVATDDKGILESMRKSGRSEPSSLDGETDSMSRPSRLESGVSAPAAPALEEIEEDDLEILRGERPCPSPSALESLSPPSSSSSGGGGIKLKGFHEGMTNRVGESGNEDLPPWSASLASSPNIPHPPLPPPPPLAFPIAPPPSHPIPPFLAASHGAPEEAEDRALQLALGLVDSQGLPFVEGHGLPVYRQTVAPPAVDAPSAPLSLEGEEENHLVPSAPPESEFHLEPDAILMPSAPEDENREEHTRMEST